MGLHGVSVGVGHDEPGGLAFGRADRAEDVRPLGALIERRTRPRPAPRPASGQLVLLADPGFILPPEFDLGSGRQAGADLRQALGEVF
jgi:hypothetical protein